RRLRMRTTFPSLKTCNPAETSARVRSTRGPTPSTREVPVTPASVAHTTGPPSGGPDRDRTVNMGLSSFSARPPATGLYDGRHEHDACGVAFVATMLGHAGHD